MADSLAWKRILANVKVVNSVEVPAYEGFYLSNEQIIELGNVLKKKKESNGIGPDGIYFLVGRQNLQHTIELLPFVVDENDLKVFSEAAAIGSFTFSLANGPLENVPFKYSSNQVFGIPIKLGSGQKTPPPKI
jgi:hypothetical protein